MTDQNKVVPDLLMKTLLDTLRRKGILDNPAVDAAFTAIPRHHFLPDLPFDKVYTDDAIPLKYDHTGLLISSASQPTMMAIMLDQAQLAVGMNVLEIGTASGYNAALMQHMIQHGTVTTIELEPDLVKQAVLNLQRANVGHVRVVQGDGAVGYAPRAAYDRIVATVGVWDIPKLWFQQLRTDGRLVVPLWIDGVQVSAAFVPQPDGTYLSVDNRPCAFVYLRGDGAGPELRRQVGSTSLILLADEIKRLDTAALHSLLSDDHDLCHLESQLSPQEYWNGFQLYLMLNEPRNSIFAVFHVMEGRKAYGIEGRGIALFTVGSATFAPYQDQGTTHCFGGSDAFVLMQEQLDEWNAAQRPDVEQLRLRLIPLAHGAPTITQGKLYTRRDHYLHAWLETR